jgi:hypothetical protein
VPRINDADRRARDRTAPAQLFEAVVTGFGDDGRAYVTRRGEQTQRGPCYWRREVDAAGIPFEPEVGDTAFVQETDTGRLAIMLLVPQ